MPCTGHAPGSSDVAEAVFGLQGLVAGEGPRQKVPQEVINSMEMSVLKTGIRVKRQQGAHSEKDSNLISGSGDKILIIK